MRINRSSIQQVARRPLQQRGSLRVVNLTSNDIKNGMILLIDNAPWKVTGKNVPLPPLPKYCRLRGSEYLCAFRDLRTGRYSAAAVSSEFLHVKPGKGSAFVRSKIKNCISGNTIEKTFRAGEPVSEIASFGVSAAQRRDWIMMFHSSWQH